VNVKDIFISNSYPQALNAPAQNRKQEPALSSLSNDCRDSFMACYLGSEPSTLFWSLLNHRAITLIQAYSIATVVAMELG